MWLRQSLFQATALWFFQTSHAAFLPETFVAKSSEYYSQCRAVSEDIPHFQQYIRDLLVYPMPNAVKNNIDSFLADDPEGLSQEETIGAFNRDFIELALGDKPIVFYLENLCKRLKRLFITLDVPFEDRNADLIASFLTYTILSINSPAIYSALKVLTARNNKGQLIFEGDMASEIEYVVVTLSIAGEGAINIMKDFIKAKKAQNSWWQLWRKNRNSCF